MKNVHFTPLMDSVGLPLVGTAAVLRYIPYISGPIIAASALVEAILIKPKHI